MHNPAPSHWAAVKHLLCYLCGTSTIVLTFHGSPNIAGTVLTGYVDADFANADNRRSVGAYAFFLGNSCISWKSKQQATVATSTAEAEFMAASIAGHETIWLSRLLADFSLQQTSSTPLYEDNQGCIALAYNPVHRERSKRIDTRLHNIREHTRSGALDLIYMPTAEMTADVLTKALAKPAHVRHSRHLLGLCGNNDTFTVTRTMTAMHCVFASFLG